MRVSKTGDFSIVSPGVRDWAAQALLEHKTTQYLKWCDEQTVRSNLPGISCPSVESFYKLRDIFGDEDCRKLLELLGYTRDINKELLELLSGQLTDWATPYLPSDFGLQLSYGSDQNGFESFTLKLIRQP